MAFLYGDLRLRPTRVGFLVRPSDLANLQRVFQICSCLWGGMYNPVIPVSRSLPKAWRSRVLPRLSGRQLAMGYVRFFEPDVFVETETGMAQWLGIHDGLSGLYPRVISIDNLLDGNGLPHSEFAVGLNIFDVYEDLYRNEFQFVRHNNSFVALFDDHSRHDPYIDATFGAFPEQQTVPNVSRAYKDAFNPTILKHEPAAWLQLVGGHGCTPLTLTCHDLEHIPRGEWDPTIYVANPTSPLDLIDLWNLRLLRENMLPVNAEWLPELKDYLRELVALHHRPLPRNSNGVMICTTIEVGNSFSAEEAKTLVDDTFADLPHGSWALKHWFDPIWQSNQNPVVYRPGPVQIYAKSSHLNLPILTETRQSIRFQSLAPKFASKYGNEARWVNVISLRDHANQNRLALALPSTTVASPYYHLAVGTPLLVSREGFVLPQKFKDDEAYIQLMSGTEAVVDWFKQHDIKAEPSDAGRIADQILSSVGGFQGARILQDKDTLILLNKMSKSTSQTGSAEEWQGIARKRANMDPFGGFKSKGCLDRFVEAGALKLGLSVPCPDCKKDNWYGLNDLSEEVSCQRCLETFRFPQGNLNYRNSPWKFRVAGPYSEPNYARGSYATVLALKCIADGAGFGDNTITFSANLDLMVNGEHSEIDFACWYRRDHHGSRQDEPLFLVGEAKSFGVNSFSGEDVARLKEIGQKMPGTFLVFATLKSELDEKERFRIQRLARWGRLPDANGHSRNLVIVFTGTELFAQHTISDAWKQAGGKRQAFAKSTGVQMGDLRTLADLTQQIYLGLKPIDTYLHEYWKHRYERRSQRNARPEQTFTV